MDAFVPYGGLHAVALAVCLLAIAAPALIGRALEPHAGGAGCLLLACLHDMVELARTRFAHRAAAAGVRLQRADRAAGVAERVAFRTRDFVFLDRRADASGLHPAGADRGTYLAGVLGLLDGAYPDRRLCCL